MWPNQQMERLTKCSFNVRCNSAKNCNNLLLLLVLLLLPLLLFDNHLQQSQQQQKQLVMPSLRMGVGKVGAVLTNTRNKMLTSISFHFHSLLLLLLHFPPLLPITTAQQKHKQHKQQSHQLPNSIQAVKYIYELQLQQQHGTQKNEHCISRELNSIQICTDSLSALNGNENRKLFFNSFCCYVAKGFSKASKSRQHIFVLLILPALQTNRTFCYLRECHTFVTKPKKKIAQ